MVIAISGTWCGIMPSLVVGGSFGTSWPCKGLYWRHSFKPSLRLETRAAWRLLMTFVILASVEVGSLSMFIPLFTGFYTFQVVQDFRHQQKELWCSTVKFGNFTYIFFVWDPHLHGMFAYVFCFFCKDVGGFMMFVCSWRVLRLLVVLRGTKHVEVFPPSATPHLGAYAVHDPLRSHHSKVYPVLGSVTEKLVGLWLIHTGN